MGTLVLPHRFSNQCMRAAGSRLVACVHIGSTEVQACSRLAQLIGHLQNHCPQLVHALWSLLCCCTWRSRWPWRWLC